MASPDSDKSKSNESSPSYHSMVLRSACRLCCAAEVSDSPQLSSRRVHRRNVHKSNLNGDILHIHHHHHHHHPQDSSSSEKFVVRGTGSAEAHLSEILASQTISSKQQQEATTENIASKLYNALHKSSSVEQISSSLTTAKVTKKSVYNSFVNCSSTLYKETYSDYSSGNESGEFYCGGEVNNSYFKEDMSRTRAKSRAPLSSSRFASVSDSDENEDINVVLQGRHSENLRSRSSLLIDSNAGDIGLNKILHYSSNGKQGHKTTASESSHLYSTEGSHELIHSNEIHREDSFLSSSASDGLSSSSRSDFIFTLFRWLFWKCIYLTICDILLFDTWILSRSDKIGKKKILFLLLCILIPLWLLGTYFAGNYSDDIHSHFPILKSAEIWSALFSFTIPPTWYGKNKQEHNAQSDSPADVKMTQSVWSNMWNFFSQKDENSVKSNIPTSDKSVLETSIESHNINEEKIRLLALEVFRKESNQLMEQLEKKSSQDYNEQGNEGIRSEINLVTSQYQSLSDSLQALKGEIKQQLKSDEKENLQSHPQLLLLNSKLQDLEEKLVSFETLLASAKNCCGNQSDYLSAELHLTSLLMKVMEGHEDENHPILSAFQTWLRSSFISRNNLSDEIAAVIEHMYGNSLKLSQEHYEDIAKKAAEAIISKSMKSLKRDIINISKTATSSVSSSHYTGGAFRTDDIQKIVKEAILLYDADKTGLVDYALESGGGSVVSTRCSETYNAGTARLSILGLPLWYTSKSPRTAIQPEVQPGECWAFHGSQGFLVIQLSATIQPTGFSLEHIPKSLSPTGTIDSAPKEFSVWGLTSEKNDVSELLGEFVYDSDGDPLQYFPLETNTGNYYSVIELKIHSNWGNQKYTCLYRFRVHGTPI